MANEVCRARNWGLEETNALMRTYNMFLIDRKFEGLEKHNKVWEELASTLTLNGYQRTGLEVRTKMKNLKAKFMEEKMKTRSGSSPSQWAHFGEMMEAFGARPVFCEARADESIQTEQTPGASSSHRSPDGDGDADSGGERSGSGSAMISSERRSPSQAHSYMKELIKHDKEMLEVMREEQKRRRIDEERERETARCLQDYLRAKTALVQAQLEQARMEPGASAVGQQQACVQRQEIAPVKETVRHRTTARVITEEELKKIILGMSVKSLIECEISG